MQQTLSTCDATLLPDTLHENVARVTNSCSLCVLILFLRGASYFMFNRINSDGECSKTREYWTKTLENWEERQVFSPKQVKRIHQLQI